MSVQAALTRRYVLALILVASALLGSHAAVVRQSAKGAEDGATINRAGVQRMLSQRIALLASELADEPDPARAERLATSLEGAVERMAFNHAALSAASLPGGEARAAVTDPAALYFGPDRLDERVRRLLTTARALVAEHREGDPDVARDAPLARRITALALDDGLLEDLDAVVDRYQEAFELGEHDSRRLERLLLIVAGIVLLLEAGFVFRPMVRKVVDAVASLNRLAYADGLTGLANRNRFHDELEAEVAAAARGGPPVALLLLDLDHFKQVNDTLGHDVGDELLVEAGRRMQDCLPDSALLARLGGDEFTVIVRGEEPLPLAQSIAERIVRVTGAPFPLGRHQVHVSASVGIGVSGDGIDTATELVKSADLAMYEAKASGRGRFVLFGQDMRDAIADELALVEDLRSARANGELELFYQPVTRAASGEVVEAEALLRWHHPTRGLIHADTFVPLAEADGLIGAIGDWVFTEAAHRVATWRAIHGPRFRVGINVSSLQLRRDDPVPGWIAAVRALGIDPASLAVEVTEDVLTGNREPLEALRAAGFRIVLDDYGVGSSSFLRLRELDVDGVKIARSLVAGLAPGSDEHALCRAIVALAHQFGLEVTAKGVETDVQRALLLAEGCDCLQGELHSSATDAASFEACWLEAAPRRAAWRARRGGPLRPPAPAPPRPAGRP